MNALLESLRGTLIVSCQAYPGEPMCYEDTMTRVARAVAEGGAAGIRAQGLGDIAMIREALDLPLIGLWKDGDSDVFITPTLEHALATAEAGSDIVAIDGTSRTRPDGRSLEETISAIKDQTGKLVMADCSTVEEGIAAARFGADVVGTTLSGYTAYTVKTEGPDFELISTMASSLNVPVIAEGRIHTPQDAVEAIRSGAFAVVVGSAITHPTSITRWFNAAVKGAAAGGAGSFPPSSSDRT